MQYATFKVEMGRLALVYGEQPPERLLEYWQALGGVPDARFQAACAAYKMLPGVRRFPFTNELSELAADAAGSAHAAAGRALAAGSYQEAKTVIEALTARLYATAPPDPERVAYWQARFDDMCARRDATEAARHGTTRRRWHRLTPSHACVQLGETFSVAHKKRGGASVPRSPRGCGPVIAHAILMLHAGGVVTYLCAGAVTDDGAKCTLNPRRAAMEYDAFFAELTREYARPFVGWDFHALEGRRVEDAPPWSFADLSRKVMRDATALLDLGTGGGERLSALHDAFPPSVVATEGYPPNLALARQRLTPLGVDVYDSAGSLSERLPFASGAFDLVISRNTAFNAAEVARVLRDGGVFLTQQVDGRPQDLQAAFGATAQWPDFTLGFMRTQIAGAGLTIERATEWAGAIAYTDLGALVYFLKAVP